MNGFVTVAVVVGIFFMIGIAVGVLLVTALPMLRAARHQRRNRRRYVRGGDWLKLQAGDDEGRPPRWPVS